MSNKNKKSLPGAITTAAAIVLTVLGGTAAAQGPVDAVGLASSTVLNQYTPGGANPAPNVFVSLPGAVVNMVVPPGATRLFLATYSAESACYGGPAAAANWCPVRILIGGVEGAPASGADFAFDSNDNGAASIATWESHSMQRFRRITNTASVPLAVPIIVQRTTTNVGTTLRLDDWTLSVLRSQP
jgi:hypothetical protein